MNYFLLVAALVHMFFTVAELYPWSLPLLLGKVSEKSLKGDKPFTPAQQELVATIVHNAGIYNGILAGGLLWAALPGNPAPDVARVMLAGAVVAGIFGAVTMKSPIPAGQAIIGVIGLILV